MHEDEAGDFETMEPAAHSHTMDLVVDELPGVDALDPELEAELEAGDEESEDDLKSSDVKSSEKKSKPREKFDFAGMDTAEFTEKAKELLSNVPKHSGYDRSGLERAISYFDRLDNEISKAMRSDHDGKLDFNVVEHVRAEIEKGQDLLAARIEKLNKGAKKTKRASTDLSMVKEAQRAPGIMGIVITVPLLISRIGRVCINGSISAGHSMNDIFFEQAEKYKLNDREKAEVAQFISDCGYPLIEDRGAFADEEVSPESRDNVEWSQQFKA
jgi:hypothetical protein